MYKDRRVVVVIPAGRRRYLEILMDKIIRQGCGRAWWIDEIRVWCNSYDEEDIQYINALEQKDPKITIEHHDIEVDRLGWGWSIYPFFKKCVDPNTVYVRLDDDIVWMEEGAIERLIDFRLENPQYFLVYGNIVNNPITSHIHQRLGAMHTRAGIAQYDFADPTGYTSAEFWDATHRNFFNHFQKGTIDRYKFDKWELSHFERMPINCIAWLGEDIAAIDGNIPVDEERFLSSDHPIAINRINCIYGQAVFCHSAFWKQRIDIFKKNSCEHEYNTHVFQTYKNLTTKPSDIQKLKDGISKINQASPDQLRDRYFVESIISSIGLTPDGRGVYGEYSKFQNELEGLYQIPPQFAEAMIYLSGKRLQSAIEIGTWYGWTATFMAAYLRRFNPNFRMLTIDKENYFRSYEQVKDLVPLEYYANTTSDAFEGRRWDLCFIDGDHTFNGVNRDWENIARNCDVCMFHDINDQCVFNQAGYDGGVVSFWEGLKASGTSIWKEFTDGSEDWMGVGIAEPRPEVVEETIAPEEAVLDDHLFGSYFVHAG